MNAPKPNKVPIIKRFEQIKEKNKNNDEIVPKQNKFVEMENQEDEAGNQVISSNKSTKRKNKERVKIETDENG